MFINAQMPICFLSDRSVKWAMFLQCFNHIIFATNMVFQQSENYNADNEVVKLYFIRWIVKLL